MKVLDFGLAKALDGAGGAGRAGEAGAADPANSPTMANPARIRGNFSAAGTEAGMILGTAAYMSPEQARGRTVDRRADIWAWGCVLFEMLAGRAAFAGDSVTDILAKVIEREPDFSQLPATTPPHITRIIRRCLLKDPRKRVQHVGDARLELDQPVSEPTGPIAPAASSVMRILPWALAVAASVVAAAALWRGGSSSITPEVWRFEIAFPAGIEGLSSPGSVAIAPDGRSLALIGNRQGLRTLLFRDIHELEAREIPQVAGAVSVVYSPDGASLAVTTVNGEIWQVSPAEN